MARWRRGLPGRQRAARCGRCGADAAADGRFLPATAALFVCLLARAPARAGQPPRVVLEWSAPAGCPSGADVSAAVEQLLRDSGSAKSASPPQAPLRASALITKDPRSAFRAHLAIETPDTRRVREFQGTSCAAVADATALILALTIDPSVVPESPSGSAPARTDRPAEPSAATPSARLRAEPTGRPRPEEAAGSRLPTLAGRPDAGSAADAAGAVSTQNIERAAPGASSPSVSFRFRAWGGADAGSLPAVAAGVGASLALVSMRYRFELGASLWPERAARAASHPSSGADVGLIAGSLGICREVVLGSIVVGPCFDAEIGRMSADGFGVNDPHEREALWAALKPGARLTFQPGSRLAVVLHLEASFPLSRPMFTVIGAGVVHRPGPVAGRASAGLEFSF